MNSQTKTTSMTPHSFDLQQLDELLAQQKYAYQNHPLPTAKERIDRLARLKRIKINLLKQLIKTMVTVLLVKPKSVNYSPVLNILNIIASI